MGVHERTLGAVVEVPDYGYKIVERLGGECTTAAIYKALGNLRELGLIEKTEVSGNDDRPKKWYRATARGVREHSEYVSLVLQKRLSNARPETIAAVIEEIDLYERRVLESLREDQPEGGDLVSALIADERRSVSQARLGWAVRARERVDAASSA